MRPRVPNHGADAVGLVLRICVPLAVAVFCIIFFVQMNGATLLSAVYPRILIALLVLGLLPPIIWAEIRAFRQQTCRRSLASVYPDADWRVLILLPLLLVAWTAALDWSGYLAASLILYVCLAATLMKLSPSNLLKALVAAGLFLGFAWLLFGYLLGVPLPRLPWD